MDRRTFIKASAAGVAVVATRSIAFPEPLRAACGDVSPYGPLLAPDVNGIALPDGFTSTVVAISGQRTTASNYVWHKAPDGGACFPLASGGWVYVSNSEVAGNAGGASSISFDPSGRARTARRILWSTNRNCSGGATPWGRWLSCEEHDAGYVWECHPLNSVKAVRRPAMGRFQHEAAVVDEVNQCVYMTEDKPDGRLYRYRYGAVADLSTGTLEVAIHDPVTGLVTWTIVPDPAAATVATRYQVVESTAFNGGEGAWFAGGRLVFTTKGDNRVWEYDPATSLLRVIYDVATSCSPVLSGVDNITVSPAGDLFIAEDGGDMQLVLLTADGTVVPFLQVFGQDASELTGPAFNPAGTRLYFSSQKGGPAGSGITYEVAGPFRTTVPV